MSADRQRVVLIARDVEDRGGMEQNVRRGMPDVDFCVVSSTQEPGLRGRVEWKRVLAPRRPVRLRLAAFYLLGALQVVRAGPGTASVDRRDRAQPRRDRHHHLCHAGYPPDSASRRRPRSRYAENRWPPAGRKLGRRWREPMAAAGENPMAVDTLLMPLFVMLAN